MSYQELEIERIKPNPMNPRKSGFDGPSFDELCESIHKKGVLQPIVVRPLKVKHKCDGIDSYEIVAGERRWRAACRVNDSYGENGFGKIPAMIRDLTDDEAFEIMTIENLQREDLDEFEEAQSFSAYVNRHGKNSEKDLAERLGIDARYIRRRTRILTLPQEVLLAWQKGKLKYGHLEQLRRLEKPEEIKRLFRKVLQGTLVEELKRDIDGMAVPLGKACFKTSEAGCKTCPKNSAYQKDLFGTETDKASCLDPQCFMERQKTWLTAHWDESPLRKKYGTNGFRLRDYGENLNHENFWGAKPKKECKACAEYVTILSHRPGEIFGERACLNPACYRKTYRRPTLSGRQYEDPKQRTGRRSNEQGILFRENFFRERIPQLIEAIEPARPEVDRLALVALLHSNRQLQEWFVSTLDPLEQRQVLGGEDELWGSLREEDIWNLIEHRTDACVRTIAREAALRTIMQSDFGHDGRLRVARSLGMDLQQEWRLHENYLRAKTTKEMLAMGESLGIFKDEKAQAFLFEKLGKKRGKFEACKKGELIRVFLESGIDLAGKVPDEILVKERTCRICGCTGGCYWIEEDLCSACVVKAADKAREKKKKANK